MSENLDFNEKFRRRTKKFAINVIHFYSNNCKKTEELRIIGKQLFRSATSVASNFRAYSRGRSNAERFAKICIVVEEADETQFWLELIEESNLINSIELTKLKEESIELVKVFTATKATIAK